MSTWVEDIVQALKNLGGQTPYSDIYEEVERIRKGPLPESWKFCIQGTIETYSSDSKKFNGKDYFQKVDKGVWALRDNAGIATSLLKRSNNVYKQEEPRILESFDTISNILRTIKEYREYSDPDSPTWMEYLKEFFNVLGFRTTEAGVRLLLLRTLGEIGTAKAIVSIVLPGENFEVIGSEIQWETYLRYAANYHHVDWGILTDGIQLQAFDYGNHWDQSTLSWQDLDEIITKEKTDKFFAIYKVFSYIKGNTAPRLEMHQTKPVVRKVHTIASIPKALANILDVCKKMDENGGNYTKACKIVTQENGLSSPHTVPDACTRRIGLNTEGFKNLFAQKKKLINHLVGYYPDFSEEINNYYRNNSNETTR